MTERRAVYYAGVDDAVSQAFAANSDIKGINIMAVATSEGILWRITFSPCHVTAPIDPTTDLNEALVKMLDFVLNSYPTGEISPAPC